VTDVLNLVAARNVVRTVAVPKAAHHFRAMLHDEGAGDVEDITSRAMRLALAETRDAFPAMSREQGAKMIELFTDLCAKAFADEYKRAMFIEDTSH
jgi:hypothetical protein